MLTQWCPHPMFERELPAGFYAVAATGQRDVTSASSADVSPPLPHPIILASSPLAAFFLLFSLRNCLEPPSYSVPAPDAPPSFEAAQEVDAELRKLVDEMIELMYAHEGVGLAANQVDLPYRLFVANAKGDPAAKEVEQVFINPVLRGQGQAEDEEGCLSIPEMRAPVVRNATIKIRRVRPRRQ